MFNSNHATFDAFFLKKPAAVSLFLTLSNVVRLVTVSEKLFFWEQSGHGLVRGISDVVNSFAGFLIAVFIFKQSLEHSKNLDTLCQFNESVKFPIKIYLLIFFFEFVVLSLNSFTFLVEQNQVLYHLSCITTDIFIILMDSQIVCVQYTLFAFFKLLNVQIATQPLNEQSVAHLRRSHSKLFNISEKFHKMYDAVSLALIATHSFYFQLDLFYLISSLYNLQVQDRIIVGDKKYLFEYILWSFVNFTSTLLIFLGYSIVEIEVIFSYFIC
jgi:hypothetical protein